MKKRFEKRHCHRFEIPGAYIRYQKKGVWAKMLNNLSGRRAMVDISKGGLCFEDNGKIKIGDKVTIYLYLPHGACWPIKGDVVWKTGEDCSGYYVGVQFAPFASGLGYNPPETLEALRSLEELFTHTQVNIDRAA